MFQFPKKQVHHHHNAYLFNIPFFSFKPIVFFLTKFSIPISPSSLRKLTPFYPSTPTYLKTSIIIFSSSLVHIPTSKILLSELSSLTSPIRERKMSADWGPVVVAVVLFILLSPGLLFQIPARTRVMEFGNMHTSGIAILVHGIIYFCILTILVIAIGIHIHVN